MQICVQRVLSSHATRLAAPGVKIGRRGRLIGVRRVRKSSASDATAKPERIRRRKDDETSSVKVHTTEQVSSCSFALFSSQRCVETAGSANATREAAHDATIGRRGRLIGVQRARNSSLADAFPKPKIRESRKDESPPVREDAANQASK